MTVDFVKLSPTQNMTLLITNYVPRKDHIDCASKLMQYQSLYAEQAGFVEKPENPNAVARLQMMGGEFCGNATMALGVLIARNLGLEVGKEHSIWLESSGCDDLVECRVTPMTDHFMGMVKIPLPLGIRKEKVNFGSASAEIVDLPGITHCVFRTLFGKEQQQELINYMMKNYQRYTNQDAIGLLFLDQANSEMLPLVYVPSVNSLVWERGCGTGSAAVGCTLTAEAKQDQFIPLKQPGGTIEITTVYDGALKEVWIKGRVDIVAEGKAYY